MRLIIVLALVLTSGAESATGLAKKSIVADTMCAYAPEKRSTKTALNFGSYAKNSNGDSIEYITVISAKKTYATPDEAYYDNSSGTAVRYNTEKTAYHEHEFYPSPSEEFLFVRRKCSTGVSVGYLYSLSNGFLKAVHIKGKRLDEAAYVHFAKVLHLQEPSISKQGRMVRFIKWRSDSSELSFRLLYPTNQKSKLKAKDYRLVYCAFNTRTQKFRLERPSSLP